MRFKIYFNLSKDKNENIIPFINQKELNKFIYRTLGDGNKYHDAFSDYSISSIQGGKFFDKNHIIFLNRPYIYVSSKNIDFLTTLTDNIEKRKYNFFNHYFDEIEIENFRLNEYCDKVNTLSPILLKRNDIKITFHDENFIESLKDNCVAKLKHFNIFDNSFNIEMINVDKAKKKLIVVGNTFNICSMIRMKIYGKRKTREILYDLGLGNSTGCGFGAVEVNK